MAMKSTIKTQSKSTALIVAASFFALGCAVIGGRAQAADPQQPLTKTVIYGDLNIDSEQGAKALYARLRSAARDVCFPFDGRDLIQQSLWQSCVDNAVASAVVRVNKTRVTALHNQTVNHSGKG
jgi:UrcA family protein